MKGFQGIMKELINYDKTSCKGIIADDTFDTTESVYLGEILKMVVQDKETIRGVEITDTEVKLLDHTISKYHDNLGKEIVDGEKGERFWIVKYFGKGSTDIGVQFNNTEEIYEPQKITKLDVRQAEQTLRLCNVTNTDEETIKQAEKLLLDAIKSGDYTIVRETDLKMLEQGYAYDSLKGVNL